MTERTVAELAHHVGDRVVGDDGRLISSAAGIAEAQAGQITFLANPRYTKWLADTRASVVLVAEPVNSPAAQIIVENPYYGNLR